MEAIETLNLTKQFGSRTAVKNLNLTVKQGEIFALLGMNGAGKTTLIKMITGLLSPTEGDIKVLGKPVKEAKAEMNWSPQETAVAPNLSVRENLELIARLYGLPKEAAEVKAKEMMEEFHLSERSKELAKKLSGGLQRRLSLAMAMITEPKIVFLDEPTLGLDVVARRELWRYITALRGRVTVILTTHYLEEAENLSDRVAVLCSGRLKACGTAAELKRLAGKSSFEDAFLYFAEAEL